MKNQITSSDYEQISAYLDNQLSSKERAHLEARMKENPELEKEMYEISQTRLLIRSLPKLRAPRNYYISPKVSTRPIKARPTLRLAPTFGIVSAIASILFGLVVFGDRLLSTSTPVALAPIPESKMAIETQVVSEQVQRSVIPTAAPTEVPPMVMMGAQLAESPTPPSSTMSADQGQIPTPTTIYLYAYLPTSTPESSAGILEVQTELSTSPCGEYTGSEVAPTQMDLTNCPTATITLTETLKSIQPTSTPVPSETPTRTPTPTDTPTLSPTPTPTLTEMPPSLLNIEPTSGEGVPSEMTAPVEVTDTSGISAGAEPTQATSPTPDVTFIRYIVLISELSLAAIAVLAGFAAIILRIQAGR